MILSTRTLVAGAALLALSLPSRAVVLRQKWQAGQKLTYAVNLDGTANVQLPPGTPGMAIFAGIQMEVPVQGQGVAALDTLKVDGAGTGTVAVTLPQWQMNAQVMGLPAQFTLDNGKTALRVNGQPISLGALPQTDGKPTTALKISPSGQLKGFEPLQPVAPSPNGAPAGAIAQSAFITQVILRALPSLWPARDVQVGDTWKADVDFPGLERPAQDDAPAKPLGAFDLKLEGAETVGGKSLQRVHIKGDLDLDGKTLEAAFPPNANAPKDGNPQPKLDHATQTVNGTLWLDARAGQLAKAQLVVGGRAQLHTLKPDGTRGPKSWLDFTGTLNMALQP